MTITAAPWNCSVDIVSVRPQVNETLAIKAARHPIKEKIQQVKYIPNDIYATQQNRLQIITGMCVVMLSNGYTNTHKAAT